MAGWGGAMLIAFVLGAAWGGWRLAAYGRGVRDRFLLRWCSAVSAVLAAVAAFLPALFPVLHLWLAAIAAGALMLWVLGQGPVAIRALTPREQRRLLIEALLIALFVALLARFAALP
ncbi:MAG: hypothetical protein JJT90_16825 [Ectothiorhodospiraceae bacterium]|nr:hypothetical protein [Ectothiorhodospiraceae bacterium]